MKAFLRSSDGILALRPKITTIGKHDDSDVVLKSPGLEDHHAAIEFSDAEHSFILRDFNTGSGTFVNDCHIQNVAVKVGPGDVLRFGSGGPAFELVLDNPPQVPCPLVNRRVAWPGQIQVVTETASPPAAATASQFPLLPSPQSLPTNPGWSYATSRTSPRPPLKKRPGSAWGRTVSSSTFSPDASSQPPAALAGNGAFPGPLAISPPGDTLLKEKEETILKLGDEINRLSAFESECSRKDTLIAELQREISGMTEKVTATLAKREAEFQQKLASLDKDADTKAEEIKSLKEQVTSLQKNTSEVLYHSLSERDLQIAHWKQEHEVLKKSYSLTTGLVTSLQKDVVTKEQRIQQLRMDTDKLRQESREKDNQLAYISAQQIKELELQASQSKEEIKKRCAEQETLTQRLVEVTKAEGELRKEAERRSQQVQELGRRERLLRSEMEQVTAQAQHFRNQVLKALFPELPEEPLTEEQIVEEISRMQAAKEGSDQKEAALRKEVQIKALEMEKLSSNLALLKKSLDGFQDVLKTSYCGHSLKEEISHLQNLAPLAPLASGIQVSLGRILYHVLSWVEAVESLLRDVGVDTSAGETGMASYVKQLLDQHHNIMGQVQALQNRLRMAEEFQHSTLQEKLKELKEQLEEEFQAKERKIQEEGKQQMEILATMATLEEAKLQEALEEERKRVQELEAQVKELSEVIRQGTNLEGTLNAEFKESLEALKAAKSRTAVAEEKLLVWETQLRSLETEAEVLKQKHREEVSEYQEQVKQHARTIVDLEKRLTAAAAQQGQEGSMSEQPEAKKEACKPLPASQELFIMEEFHVFLKEELAAAKQEIQANQAVISDLKKELSKARATMSDVIGELSEKQKTELEEKRSLVQNQARELSHLREKLSETSRLLGQKETNLQAATEELRRAREKVKELLVEVKEKAVEQAKVMQHKSVQTRAPLQDDAPSTTKDPPLLCLADLGARCKGSRHDEIIHRQKETLAELRKRIRKLEKGHPDSDAKNSEPLLVLRKLPAERCEPMREKDQAAVVMVPRDAHEPPCGVSILDPNVTVERAAKLEMADALELSENLYFGFIRGLSSLMGVEELMGLRTLKHLPQAEREKVSLLRQKDLELLLDRIGKLKSRLERKESLLKEYEGDIGHFRSNKQTLQACQSRMARLTDQVYRDAEEKALLKEALERTRLQLNQEKRLNRALKKPKTLTLKKLPSECPKTAEGPRDTRRPQAHCSGWA